MAGQRGGRGEEERGPSVRWSSKTDCRNEKEGVTRSRWELTHQRNRAKENKKTARNYMKLLTWGGSLDREKSATCGSRRLIWIHQLSSALISAGVEKAKCLYYFISQLAARRLLSLCAYWPTVCGYSFIVWGALYKRSITGEWLDYGVINALY